MKRLALLTAGTLLFWGAAVYPGLLLFGPAAFSWSAAAVALCLAPALITLAWAQWSGQSPEQQLLAVMGGTGVRMVVALGGGLLLNQAFPEQFAGGFWGWLLVVYLFVLTLEIVLVVNAGRAVKECHGSGPNDPRV